MLEIKDIQYNQMMRGARLRQIMTSAAFLPLLFVSHQAFAQSVGNTSELLVSASVYAGTASTVTVGQALPGGGVAVANGSYPFVFNNDTPDSSFGVTSPVFIKKFLAVDPNFLIPTGTLKVPTSQVVTSFSSKSELSLHLSADGKAVTFMGYASPINALDVSNSNTPGHVNSTNPVTGVVSRVVEELDFNGSLHSTLVSAYSGNNGRGAILANKVNGSSINEYLMVGNAGNGSGTEPLFIVDNTGVQVATPSVSGSDTVIGAQQGTVNAKNGFQFGFAVGLIGDPDDKSGKDDNFRSLAVFNNTLYVSKGSGSNGVNTVYQVGTAGTLPTQATSATTQISILPGFPTALAKTSTGPTAFFPFGLWFANATTLYVADEGDGVIADATVSPHAGLQKWILTNGTWQLAYTLQKGLNLGTPYSVKNYPTSVNPATDGLRNITGRLNHDGTVTIFAATSTVSALADQGADPNEIVTITDKIADQTLPANEDLQGRRARRPMARSTAASSSAGKLLERHSARPRGPLPALRLAADHGARTAPAVSVSPVAVLHMTKAAGLLAAFVFGLAHRLWFRRQRHADRDTRIIGGKICDISV